MKFFGSRSAKPSTGRCVTTWEQSRRREYRAAAVRDARVKLSTSSGKCRVNENVAQVNFTSLGPRRNQGPRQSPRLPAHSVTARRVQVSAKPCSATNRFNAFVLRAPPSRPPSSATETRLRHKRSRGNAFCKSSTALRIEPKKRKVQNAKALYDQAVDEFQAVPVPNRRDSDGSPAHTDSTI